MKLKKLLDEKVIDFLHQYSNDKKTTLDRFLEQTFDENGNLKLEGKKAGEKLSWQEAKPYLSQMGALMAFCYLEKSSPDYYQKLTSEIARNKSEAEINPVRLLSKLPGITLYFITQALSYYKRK
jgi:hypothetical protein